MVRQLQRLGDHFSPFFEAVVDLVQARENTPEQLVFTTILRAMMITAYILAAYAVLRILNTLISREIIIEEEIIIDHDEDDQKESGPRRGARDKKNK